MIFDSDSVIPQENNQREKNCKANTYDKNKTNKSIEKTQDKQLEKTWVKQLNKTQAIKLKKYERKKEICKK